MKNLFSTRTLALMSAAIAINMAFGQLVSMLKLPIFLDSIGTVVVAMMAGPLAAVVAGVVTNLLWGLITDPVAAAFAPVAAVIGLVAGLCARSGGYRTLPRALLSSLLITLGLMVVATPIRTYLFGGVTGSGADFAVAYLHAMGKDLLESVALTVFAANLADKVITVLVAWYVVRRLPERVLVEFPDATAVR
ncbi:MULTISPECIES: ECF transporter S component [unclassified Paludibacterium]|uniref:ECF transporter S component n=1 Tax=unclassified Paludibacterium TaxID=2618429 RepID=UPI001C058BE9|nr:ECF transporter S component [Paludibacterium sp. B53371]BEV72144.1 ECF transporter S component [Paludibacterium sp. THUN1379]